MDIEKRRICAWFEDKVKQKFEISDQQGNHLGEWTLKEVKRLSSIEVIDGEKKDSYWLKFDSKVQWHDGLYLLKAEDGEQIILFANALSPTEMQASVN